jgi:hypothetical protein
VNTAGKAPARRNGVPAQRINGMPGSLPEFTTLDHANAVVSWDGKRVVIDFPEGTEIARAGVGDDGRLLIAGTASARKARPAEIGESLASVAADVRDFLNEAVQFTYAEDAELITMWCLMAHMYRDLTVFPHLYVAADTYGVGKTWLQRLVTWLTGGKLKIGTSAAAFLRNMGPDDVPTTMGLDEIGRLFKALGSDRHVLESIINANNKYGITIDRLDPSGATIEYNARIALVLGGLVDRPLPPDVTSRFVEVRMSQYSAERAHDIDLMTEGAELRAAALHQRISAAVAANAPALKAAARQRVMVHGTELIGRDMGTWKSLVGPAAVIGGEWPAALTTAAERRVMLEAPHQESLAEEIRTAFFTAFSAGEISPSAYKGLGVKPDLSGTALSEFDLMVGSGKPYAFKRMSLHVNPNTREFTVRWRAGKTGDSAAVAERLNQVMRRTGDAALTGQQLESILWKAGMLRTQAGRSSMMARTFGTDSAQQRTIVLPLGKDPRVGWLDDQEKNPADVPDGE